MKSFTRNEIHQILHDTVIIDTFCRDFILAVPAGSEFSLDIQSSSGDEVSCDIIIAEHDSTSTHKTPVCTVVTMYSVVRI